MRNILVFALALILLAGCAQQIRIVYENGTQNVILEKDTSPPKVEDISINNSNVQAPNESVKETPKTSKPSKAGELMLGPIQLSTMIPEPNQNLTVKFQFFNKGTSGLDDVGYSVSISQGNKTIASDEGIHNSTIAVNSSASVESKFKIADIGSYNLTVKIDPENQISEENELDNKKTLLIAVKKVYAPLTTHASSSQPCVDSDNGRNWTYKGVCQDLNEYQLGVTDSCESSSKLDEYYCKNNECVDETHMCVCLEGVCIQ